MDYESKVKHCTAASLTFRESHSSHHKKKKVDLISYYRTRGMPIATCHGQFQSQDLWFKYNIVLIVCDAEHFMLIAALLQVTTT